jgi:hypothetical protein
MRRYCGESDELCLRLIAIVHGIVGPSVCRSVIKVLRAREITAAHVKDTPTATGCHWAQQGTESPHLLRFKVCGVWVSLNTACKTQDR